MYVCVCIRERPSAVFPLGVQAIGAQLWGLLTASRPQPGDSQGEFRGERLPGPDRIFIYAPKPAWVPRKQPTLR